MGDPERTRRWEGDERGTGVADASAFAARLEVLREHARRSDWVAEAPEDHLWPHLERAITAADSPWRIVAHATDPAGVLVIELGYERASGDAGPARLRADAMALVGQVAEGATFVDVVGVEEGAVPPSPQGGIVVIDVLTGMLDGRTPFQGHGHTLRLRIRQG
jgi:hypothetical protein